MQLKEYLRQKKISVAEFARLIHVNYHQIYYIIRGGRAKLDIAAKIIKHTNGDVTVYDLLEDRTRPW